MLKKLSLLLTVSLLTGIVLLSGCGPNESGGEDEMGFDYQNPTWWVRPEDYEPEGISAIDFFQLLPEENTLVCYDRNGFERSKGSVTYNEAEQTLLIDAGYASTIWLIGEGELLDPDSQEVLYVRTENPQFRDNLDIPESYDGTWYLNGDPNASVWFEIEGSHYAKMTNQYGGTDVMEEGEWEPGASIMMFSNGMDIDIAPSLEGEFPGPTLYPVAGGIALFEQDLFDYICYIHSDALDNEEAAALPLASVLMNSRWVQPGEDFDMRLYLTPQIFQVTAYRGGNPTPEKGDYDGTWTIAPDGTVTLNYLNGTSDSFLFREDTDLICLDSLGLELNRSER